MVKKKIIEQNPSQVTISVAQPKGGYQGLLIVWIGLSVIFRVGQLNLKWRGSRLFLIIL